MLLVPSERLELPRGREPWLRGVRLDLSSIRVAALIDTFHVSGPGRQLVAIAPLLRHHGIETRLILFQRRGEPPAPFESFVKAAGIPYQVVTDAGRFDPRLLPRVNRILREWQPQVVQTHNYRPSVIAFALRKRPSRWRWVGFFHGLTAEDRKVRLYHLLDRRLLRHADRIVVMSRAQRLLFPKCEYKVLQIANAVLPPESPEDDAGDTPGLVSTLEHPRLAVVARLSHEKGVDLFLRALRLVRDRGLSASAVVAGDGPERASLTRLAASLDLSTVVRFLGTVHPIEPLYRCVDVVVLPSRSEGLPNVLLEALRAHRPIVATRVGAVPEIVTDPLAAHLVEPGSPEALAEAMLKATATPLTPTAVDAQKAILNLYSLERRLHAHLGLYRELNDTGGFRTSRAGEPRPSIEIVIPALEVAGMERVVAHLATALRGRGYSVGITCVDAEGPMAPELRAAGIRVTHVTTSGRRSFFWPVGLRRWFETIAPDIVHIHNEPWLKAALAARQALVPVALFTLHGRTPENWVDYLLDRRAAKLSSRITTVSEPLRDHLIDRLDLEPQQVLSIPNGVDIEAFSPNPARGAAVRSNLGLAREQPLIGMVARLEPVKNHDCLLRAFVKVVADHPAARLLLVGDGQLRPAIEERIREYGLRESVWMAGERDDVADVYRALDVCVLPSLAEGSSISILEAMASGVSIVASDVGGTPDLLGHGSCGLLVPVDQPEPLASAIIKLIHNPDLRRGLAGAARRRCSERYTFATMLDRYERLYLDEVASRRTIGSKGTR